MPFYCTGLSCVVMKCLNIVRVNIVRVNIVVSPTPPAPPTISMMTEMCLLAVKIEGTLASLHSLSQSLAQG